MLHLPNATPPGTPVIVEVKELTVNDDERAAIRRFDDTKVAVWGWGPPGRRIRQKIEDAKAQLKPPIGGTCPAVLLLYDARPVTVALLHSYDVMVAMYGLETINLHVPENGGHRVTLGRRTFGAGGKLKPGIHTFLSAVCVLRRNAGGELHLDVYDNAFATHRLPIEQLGTLSNITLYTLPPGNEGEFGWVRVEDPAADQLTSGSSGRSRHGPSCGE